MPTPPHNVDTATHGRHHPTWPAPPHNAATATQRTKFVLLRRLLAQVLRRRRLLRRRRENGRREVFAARRRAVVLCRVEAAREAEVANLQQQARAETMTRMRRGRRRKISTTRSALGEANVQRGVATFRTN